MMGLSEFFDRRKKPEGPVVPGIYCDCFGTLYSFDFDRDGQLVDYLNRQYAAGKTVVIFSTDPRGVFDKVQHIGLHPDLVRRVRPKSDYKGHTLETLIDDNPPGFIKAQTVWDPRAPAFRTFLANEAARHSPATPAA